MNKIGKLIAGVLLALCITTSAFAADTAVKATTNAPVAVTTTPADSGVSLLWNQEKVDDQQWTFAIGGGGATGLESDSETVFGLNLQLGRTTQLVLPFEFGVRQSLGFASEGEDTTLFSTKVYADWTLLSYKGLELFAGGNIGATYGDISTAWTAAPEAGLRLWLKENVGIEGRVEFPFDIGDDTVFQDTMAYTIGLKMKF